MDLLEYQAKELFRQAGIPVLPSQRINDPSELKNLTIPYPLVLKSQVRKGERGKAGGVQFVNNTIDAIAAAQAIFGLRINGELPPALLAEVQYHPSEEFYFAILLDATSRRPMLLGSCRGGVDVAQSPELMQQVVVTDEFSPHYARGLAIKMGLSGALLLAITDVIERMYWLFAGYDLDLIEINPLGIAKPDRIMALDGKISVNAESLGRHPELAELNVGSPPRDLPSQAQALGMFWFDLTEGQQVSPALGVISNGLALTMATLDWLAQAGGTPAYALALNSLPPLERLKDGLDLLLQAHQFEVILINLVGLPVEVEQVAIALRQHYQRRQTYRPDLAPAMPHLVVRLPQAMSTPPDQSSPSPPITFITDLDEAVLYCCDLMQTQVGEPLVTATANVET